MYIHTQPSHPTIGSSDGDFSCVICQTKGCINKNFMNTVEKKSGMVIYTDALYTYDYDKQEWKPSFKRFGV